MTPRRSGRRAFELAEDPPAADPMLKRLQAIQRLQALRKLTADAEVAMARQTLARAEDAVRAMAESLAVQVRQVRDERDTKARERMAQPADIAALNRWRQSEFESIAGIERQQDALAAQRQRGAQAEEDLQARIVHRRRVVLRCEKYAALLERMNEAL
jgi:hypothetical protein